MRTKKPHQKFEHIAIHPETKIQLDGIAGSLHKKNTSYNSIILLLIDSFKEHN